jgi:hypothetical protein
VNLIHQISWLNQEIREGTAMTASEKIHIKFDDFGRSGLFSFKELREDLTFADVTLACEDTQMEVHKVILSLGTTFFKNLLRKNQHTHPLIYLRGIKAKNLVALVDFLYLKEVTLCEEDLDDFLSLAHEMELNGLPSLSDTEDIPRKLTQNIKDEQMTFPSNIKLTDKYEIFDAIVKKMDNVVTMETETFVDMSDSLIDHFEDNPTNTTKTPQHHNNTIKIPINPNYENINAMIDSLVREEAGRFKCSVCGKTSKTRPHLREHIEIHIDGAEYPCHICGKVNRYACI